MIEQVNDWSLSSFDVVKTVTESEKKCGIELSDQDIRKFVCIKYIVDYLEVHT